MQGEMEDPLETDPLILKGSRSNSSQSAGGLLDRTKQKFNNGPKWANIVIASLAAIICTILVATLVCIYVFPSGGGESTKAPLMQQAPVTATAGDNENQEQEEEEEVETVTVRTDLGRVSGITLSSREGRDYYAFYGIPYAQPPTGQLRFKPPEPPKRWFRKKDCTKKGQKCLQRLPHNQTVTGSEDCLLLNIFTPILPSNRRGGRRQEEPQAKLPVIVYFFGGALMFGDANDFNTDYFMDEDVIIVVPQYRVRALGFLNTGDGVVSGNMGLKDQVAALQWVKNYIAAFSGDPDRIVPIGTSAGAMGVHGHLLSPMSKSLISGAISLSGQILTPMAAETDTSGKALQFGIEMGCLEKDVTSFDSISLLSCLQEKNGDDIVKTEMLFKLSVETIIENSNDGPPVEELDTPADPPEPTAFLTELPANIIFQGRANKIPWLVGVTSAECIYDSYKLLLQEKDVDNLNNNFNEAITSELGFQEGSYDLDKVLASIKDFYFGNQTISKDLGTRFNLTNLIGDRTHYHPTKTASLHHSKISPVYMYYLTKEANVSYAGFVEQFVDPPYGVSHADDVQYIFSRPGYPYIPSDSPWAHFSKLFVSFLVSFAATGAPVNPIEGGVAWPPVNAADNGRVWYNLDDDPKLIEPLTDRLNLWDSFPLHLLYDFDDVVVPTTDAV